MITNRTLFAGFFIFCRQLIKPVDTGSRVGKLTHNISGLLDERHRLLKSVLSGPDLF